MPASRSSRSWPWRRWSWAPWPRWSATTSGRSSPIRSSATRASSCSRWRRAPTPRPGPPGCGCWSSSSRRPDSWPGPRPSRAHSAPRRCPGCVAGCGGRRCWASRSWSSWSPLSAGRAVPSTGRDRHSSAWPCQASCSSSSPRRSFSLWRTRCGFLPWACSHRARRSEPPEASCRAGLPVRRTRLRSNSTPTPASAGPTPSSQAEPETTRTGEALAEPPPARQSTKRRPSRAAAASAAALPTAAAAAPVAITGSNSTGPAAAGPEQGAAAGPEPERTTGSAVRTPGGADGTPGGTVRAPSEFRRNVAAAWRLNRTLQVSLVVLAGAAVSVALAFGGLSSSDATRFGIPLDTAAHATPSRTPASTPASLATATPLPTPAPRPAGGPSASTAPSESVPPSASPAPGKTSAPARGNSD